MKIAILCPTRNRPQNIERLYTSARETADKPEDVGFFFYLDKDDDISHNMLLAKPAKQNVVILIGERIVLSQMWNECYKVAYTHEAEHFGTSHYEIFMHCGDDIIFRTEGWDT